MSDLTGDVFLTFQQRGSKLRVTRATASMPRLDPTERAILVRLRVPADLFKMPPVPIVDISVDPTRVVVGTASVEVMEPLQVVELARAMQADVDEITGR